MPAPTATHRGEPTRTALLTAAESLFLTDGYEQVSVRAICAAADANPAAVHYHFGSKDRLAVELLEDRLAPRWADPLDRFDPATSDLTELVDLILAPFVDIQDDPVGRLHLRLLARFVLTHPQATWTRPWFQLDRWSGVLVQLIDGISDDDACRRWGLAFQLVLTQFGGEQPLSPAATAALADFVVAGLAEPPRTSPRTAPPAAQPKENS
ncbi:TetR/AcrR family transcriptional regulator [Gordonia hankookensis]|uniref:TetR/AcrR family transcriptional regulator n=1 Tax=Gordonia hankookensis TaxID=589403 RepID=A0ABR7WAF6_9ACTN|nr:TetR/AcrR family transcriptional regulator [Gordonia hankookensis]MBD1319790.1 TetR/AcrR family transcriptional regulator [Gordonia hankookensis]